MHDIKFIRENPAAFDAGLARRGLPPIADTIRQQDEEIRKIQTLLQTMQAQRNDISKQVGEYKKAGRDAAQLMTQVADIKLRMTELESEVASVPTMSQRLNKTAEQLNLNRVGQLHALLASTPNLPADDVPDGKDEHDNKELKRVGEPPRHNSPKQHFELGDALGLMEFERATKLSGARFTILRGALARLERALGNFMLDVHTQEYGYEEVSPPLMVREEIMYGTAQLPKFRDDQFSVSAADNTKVMLALLESLQATGLNLDDIEMINKRIPEVAEAFLDNYEKKLWLIPTAEVPLTNYVNGEIVASENLPLRFTARTPCFRAEAGAAGKDTRGMIRQHQFYKVEMVSITTPDQSEAEHERMTRCAETVLERLGLPYRRIVLCTGDMGFAARKTYDLEVWLPGQNTYREISSCSNCGDFQARRMNARFKPVGEKTTQFLHTLNGSGVAVGRCLVAIMENYQNQDGSVSIPESLRPYMGGLEVIR